MKQRILTAIVLFAIVMGVLFLDPSGVSGVVVAALALAVIALELASLIGAYGWLLIILTQLGFASFNKLSMPVVHVALAIIGVGALIGLVRSSRSQDTNTPDSLKLLRVLVAKPFLVGAGASLIALTIKRGDEFPLVLTAAIPIWAGDTAAIFAGKAFGKHKLAPSISPNKTWEGSVANLLAAVGAAAALGYFLKYPMDKMLLLGVSCGVIGQLGDLFESYLKRQAGVKDSGNLLPGHGGVFDRLDSLLMTAPFSYWILSSFLK